MIDFTNLPDEEFTLMAKIQSEIIHQKAERIDKETKDFINDYLEKNPDVKELWEKENKNA